MTDANKQFTEFPVEHGFRHKLAPESRESLAHILIFPDEKTAGFIYPSMMGTGEAKAVACFISPHINDQLIETVEGTIPDDMNFDAWQLGPCRMEVEEAFKRVNIEWNGDLIKVTGNFTATHPPYPFSTHPKGNPPYFGDNRTEQHGRFSVDVELEGKKFHHDGFLVRDHSWGPRVWGLNQHYKWIHATTGDSSMHFFEMQGYGRTELRGFLFKDGLMRHIESVDYDFVYNENMLQQTFQVIVTDTDGRKSFISYEMFGFLRSWYDPTCINTGIATIEFDGAPGVGVCEFCWNSNYFDFAKEHVSRFG
ncbi:MAG: hypothetical protein R3E21_10890 [Caenibius sp.]